ncbi:conserved hypothetical protein [Mesorhizobium metallidurans STM 2683]|uniref:Transposase n=1 Tax=Mesorhizobium metallidurans STM 2683 TaxID=1297569 RepID=M5EZ90_9HYPH|nr:IS66 family insertion sequence element accessory protein TnpB [Mesorhizobium metallidurans]CCV09512.1 conserved hypothetical protein [Mesorhizobium metallidurans STM 2683]
MMIVPAGVKVYLALGYTDMRKGLDGLAMLVQQTLKQDPFSGHLFAFRGKKASMLKILFWDGNGLCLFTKRLDQGSFAWPVMAGFNGSITLTPAQLAMLIEGIDWRAPGTSTVTERPGILGFWARCDRFGHAARP